MILVHFNPTSGAQPPGTSMLARSRSRDTTLCPSPNLRNKTSLAIHNLEERHGSKNLSYPHGTTLEVFKHLEVDKIG
jgi:hypothetical protein